MNILVACEYSGIVRDAFIEEGHNAISCDLLPSESDKGPHHQGDIKDFINNMDEGEYDLMIAHPPCTYLCHSGVRWLHEREGRWEKMKKAAEFFRFLLDAPIPRIAVENPTPHGYAIEAIGEKYTFAVQPWQFGHGEKKRTCFWLKNLPPLLPTNIVEGREARIHMMSPGNRGHKRSKFYKGIADAMAKQWGSLDG